MHQIDRLEPAVRSSVRAEVFGTLADFASGGAHGPIAIGLLFLKVCDRLAKAGIIENRPDGQEFERLKYSYPSVSYPDFGVSGVIANLIRQTFWDLFTEKILAPAPQPRKILDDSLNDARLTPIALFLDLDYVMLTPYGVEILIDSKDRIQVHDPEGYLSNFWSTTPTPDPEMMRYLAECVSVFKGGYLLASVVLLGVASERLIEVLAQSLKDSLGESDGTVWYSRYRNKEISKKFSSITNKLKEEYEQLDLNTDAFRAAELTFQYIRLARNEIAHPTDRQFTWNEVSGFLHNFVQYFKYINTIIVFLKENPKAS